MRLALIGCKVILRELYALCATSPHWVEIYWMKEGLHETPSQLRLALQKQIDAIEADPDITYDALLLGFGLCSTGVSGLHSSKLNLIIPRAHDCITLLLGSRNEYTRLFEAYNGGVYWYSAGWVDLFKRTGRAARDEAKYADYVERFGEDNAQYLMEVEGSWLKEYQSYLFIDWPGIKSGEQIAQAKLSADRDNLPMQITRGSDALLKKLVHGEWDEDVLIINPGSKIASSHDAGVVKAVPYAPD